jgi:divalent metal cation (Fe/Co/Zn/Cd) transporter
MKKIIEAFKKEERLPYVAVGIVILAAIGMLLEQFVPDISGDEIPSVEQIGIAAIFGISTTVLLVVAILAPFRAIKHDRALRAMKKDEREILHDSIVATIGYKVAVYGLVIYAFIITDVVMVALLVLILVMRLAKRIKLEREG